jgi:acetyltransferase-like isoleucine patch superfamily enzyme
MSVISRLKRGEGPVWSRLKRAARAVLAFHLPVNGLTRPLWRGLYGLHVFIRESWIWARRFFWNEPLFRSQCASVGSGLWMEELPYLQGQGRIVLGQGVRLSGKPHFAFCNRHYDAPELLIGDGTFVGHLCDFRIARSIRIGEHCLIAGGVTIADYDGHPVDAGSRRDGATSPLAEVRPVEIGDDVWIGHGAVILKGVNIGDRAVIGAHAIVTRDVPSDCIMAGNPARPVRDLRAPRDESPAWEIASSPAPARQSQVAVFAGKTAGM